MTKNKEYMDFSRGDISLKLAKGDDYVIVDKGSAAETKFRENGYKDAEEKTTETKPENKNKEVTVIDKKGKEIKLGVDKAIELIEKGEVTLKE